MTFVPSLGCLWCIKASRGMIHRLALQSHGTAKIHSCSVTWVWQRLFYYSRCIAPKHMRTHFREVLLSHILKWVWVNWMTVISLKGKWAWPVHTENAFENGILTVATLHMCLGIACLWISHPLDFFFVELNRPSKTHFWPLGICWNNGGRRITIII